MSRLFSMSAVNAVNNSEPTSTSHRSASSASVDWQEYNNCLEQQCSTTICSECRDDWRCKAKCRHSCKCDCFGLPGSSLATYGLFGKCYWERGCSPKRETCRHNCESHDCENSCEMDYLKCYCECSQQLVGETSAEAGSSVGLEDSNDIGIALRSTDGVPLITTRLAAGLAISSTAETILNSTTGIALKSTPRVVASSTSTTGPSKTAAFATSGTTTGTGDSNAAQTFSSTPSSTNVVPGSGITTVGEPSSTTKSATEKMRELVLCYSEDRRCYDAETCSECEGDWECEEKCRTNCVCGCYGIPGTSLHSRDLWSQCSEDRECERKRQACKDSCRTEECVDSCELN
ncbi:uncharacterized protein LOC113215452 [Frankliniella occidentalis]|uniref:Uncharacterized protein LOC113215452 n=1 Tax=Frankliniella occidentalis TaxID=133901 RepID=A0A9C6XV78_FRAOC|nr:uncharacterized protein LOC113215452 [Frankliniella occidentalis]